MSVVSKSDVIDLLIVIGLHSYGKLSDLSQIEIITRFLNLFEFAPQIVY